MAGLAALLEPMVALLALHKWQPLRHYAILGFGIKAMSFSAFDARNIRDSRISQTCHTHRMLHNIDIEMGLIQEQPECAIHTPPHPSSMPIFQSHTSLFSTRVAPMRSCKTNDLSDTCNRQTRQEQHSCRVNIIRGHGVKDTEFE